jgi:hypothetical protein
VAEGVVVLLEAVEVEEREQDGRVGARCVELGREVGGERAPVGESREHVGQGFRAAGLQQPLVLA